VQTTSDRRLSDGR